MTWRLIYSKCSSSENIAKLFPQSKCQWDVTHLKTALSEQTLYSGCVAGELLGEHYLLSVYGVSVWSQPKFSVWGASDWIRLFLSRVFCVAALNLGLHFTALALVSQASSFVCVYKYTHIYTTIERFGFNILKEVSYAHQGCIYLMKILWNNIHLK